MPHILGSESPSAATRGAGQTVAVEVTRLINLFGMAVSEGAKSESPHVVCYFLMRGLAVPPETNHNPSQMFRKPAGAGSLPGL
jgi:hypothetical protein